MYMSQKTCVSHIYISRFRCLDDTGGLLYHSPKTAAKIVIAAVCLHNICLMLKTPLPRKDDNGDFDHVRPGYRPRTFPRRHQPPPVVARGEKMSAARQRLVDQFFGPDAPVRKRVLISEMKELFARLNAQKQRQRRRTQAQRRHRRRD